MKYLIFLLLFYCNTEMKKNDNSDLKKLSIEWIGNIDKPIPKITICTDCKDDVKLLKSHQYNISLKSLISINSVLFSGNNIDGEIKINEKNKKVYISKLNDVIAVLIKNSENELLIQDLKIFVSRIDY